jgi:putative hydrolase of the HAD superfamily
VVSNVAEDLRPVFEAHGWADLIDGYTHSYEHRIEKPDVRIFLAACKAMGAAPSETLVVGDHAVDGGAVAAGCTVLLLPRVDAGQERGLERVLALVGS